MLEQSSIYRRSTAYFDSGVLKLYEEPLQTIVQTEGQIRLLMDWQGFTKRADVAELEKLHNSDYRTQFIQRTLQEFLEGLEESAFNGTQIMAELVRLGFLEIKLIWICDRRNNSRVGNSHLPVVRIFRSRNCWSRDRLDCCFRLQRLLALLPSAFSRTVAHTLHSIPPAALGQLFDQD
jgi:hypothetical protein